jgi:hypothetical protein
MIENLPFEPYAAVYRQKWGLVRAVNGVRKAAGYEPISPELRKKRRLVKPFAQLTHYRSDLPRYGLGT